MKIKLAFLGIIVSISFVNAQIYTPSGTIQGTSGNNNVGIGTNAPSHLLNVYGSHGDSRILLHSYGGGNDVNQADLMLWASEPGLTYTGVGIGNNIHNFNNVNGGLKLLNTARGGSYIRLLDNSLSLNVVSSSGLDTQGISINAGGNVGIGGAVPNSPLTVYGISRFYPARTGGGDARSLSINYSLANPDFIDNLYPIILGTGGGNQPLILDAARVGIGTTTPDAKLAVNGTIHSKEVKVDMSGWPDYVFKKQYDLPTLEEVEKHIKEKGHLENIPNEEEVLKNGINLGEMNAKLLQKIEELTLYMIEMKKTIEIQDQRIKILEKNKL